MEARGPGGHFGWVATLCYFETLPSGRCADERDEPWDCPQHYSTEQCFPGFTCSNKTVGGKLVAQCVEAAPVRASVWRPWCGIAYSSDPLFSPGGGQEQKIVQVVLQYSEPHKSHKAAAITTPHHGVQMQQQVEYVRDGIERIAGAVQNVGCLQHHLPQE